jgi:RNA polymerase sigma-70 factor, ECF subfamily
MSIELTDSGDDDLVARIAAGDAAAFTALFRRRQGDVFRFALHMLGSPATAEDVTQDVFLTIMRDAGRYQAGRSSVTAWLCGIARNHALRRLERERPVVPLEDEVDAEAQTAAVQPDPLGDLTKTERLEALKRAVLSLPVRYREVVVMCDLQELSYVETAETIGCAIGTVRSRLHRGRALLASKMRAPGPAKRHPRIRAIAPEEPSAPAANRVGEGGLAVAQRPNTRCFA